MEDGNLFGRKHGVIMALDMHERDLIEHVVDICNETQGVVALKMGMIPVMQYGLPRTVELLRGLTDLPLIYDHQKMGVCPATPESDLDDDGLKQARFFGGILGKCKVDGGIIYPTGDFLVPESHEPIPYESDLSVQRAFTDSFRGNGVEPFLLGRFTCDGHLRGEGGILPDDMPEKIYRRTAEAGIECYIMPGNRPEETEGFVDLVTGILPADTTPKICLPGFGSQGGTVKEAFRATRGLPSYAIIGPCDCFDLSERGRVADHVRRYCDEALAFG